MTPHPSVCISHTAGDARDRLVGWIRDLGYETDVADDAAATVALVRSRPFAVSFLDSGMEDVEGGTVWRVVHRIVGRRLVLMVREIRNETWFEALRAGVGALLPLPPEAVTVRAALTAVLGDVPGTDRATGSEGMPRWR